MKKLLMTMMAGGAMLAVTSCSSDEPVAAVNADGLVTFTVTAPVDIQSRAIGQGEAANDLRVVVFDADGKYLFTDEHPDEFAGKTTSQVQVQLITGETYKVAFWVDADNLYTIDAQGKISMGYDNGMLNLNDNRDAFYNVAEITVDKTSLNQSITLTRPFAQLNVGTEDFARATVDLKKDISKASLTVTKGVYNTLSLADGVASDLIEGSIEFTTADLPATDVLTVGGKTYTYLAMAYLLVDKNGNNLDKAEVTLYDAAGTQSFNGDISYTSLPVKRNFRTNIVGNLLTSTTDWTINLGPWESNDINIDLTPWDGTTKEPLVDLGNGTLGVTSAAQLAQLAYDVNNGDNMADKTIVIFGDFDLGGKEFAGIGNVNRSTNKAGAFTGTLDGQGHTIKNFVATSTDDNMGCALVPVANGAEIKNINVDNVTLQSGDFAGGIVGCTFGNTVIENCNVTNVNISGKGAAGGIVGRAYAVSGETTVIKDCTAEGVVSATSTSTKVGGIVGIASNNGTTIFEGCTSNVDITANTDSGAGGIVGYIGSRVEMTDCVNNGDINCEGKNAGGIVGYIQFDGGFTVTNTVNNGSVVGNETAGGIIGAPGNDNKLFVLDNCTNKGSVTATGAGGIAAGIAGGLSSGTVQNCSNTATVTGAYAGGVVGNAQKGSIINCSGGTAAITSPNGYAGRLISHVINGPDSFCYLSINDDNGDSYDGLNTVGIFAPYTGKARIEIISGTLQGNIPVGGNDARIVIKQENAANATWDQITPGQYGIWERTKASGVWQKIG